MNPLLLARLRLPSGPTRLVSSKDGCPPILAQLLASVIRLSHSTLLCPHGKRAVWAPTPWIPHSRALLLGLPLLSHMLVPFPRFLRTLPPVPSLPSLYPHSRNPLVAISTLEMVGRTRKTTLVCKYRFQRVTTSIPGSTLALLHLHHYVQRPLAGTSHRVLRLPHPQRHDTMV